MVIFRNFFKKNPEKSPQDTDYDFDELISAAQMNPEVYNQLMGRCDKYIKIKGGSAEAWNSKGSVLVKLYRFREAISCFDEAIRIDPNYDLAWSAKAVAINSLFALQEANLGELKEALKYVGEAIKLNPNSSYAKDLKQAIFEKIQENSVGVPLFKEWFGKGCAFWESGKYQEAISCYDEAIKINPKDAFTWYVKGRSFFELGSYEQAVGCYNKTLELDSKYALALSDKAKALDGLGKYEEAIACFDQGIKMCLEKEDSWVLWQGKADLLADHDKYEEAVLFYDKAIELGLGKADSWYNKGVSLVKLSRYAEAVLCYDQVLKINPDDTQAQQRKQDALAVIDKAVSSQ